MNVHEGIREVFEQASTHDDGETTMSHETARRATIRDVAAAAGVSAQTVSRVINGSTHVNPGTRAQVTRSIAELGYTPDVAAQNLARLKRSSSLGSTS
ncbi:LacI family DNA-binding transcriptional regulator [Sanguibacter keddieii]|nr:LacI family DNA-binding transcriptional regulator [Sanguibacter keddieii]